MPKGEFAIFRVEKLVIMQNPFSGLRSEMAAMQNNPDFCTEANQVFRAANSRCSDKAGDARSLHETRLRLHSLRTGKFAGNSPFFGVI
jgi:hypothetical protein